MAKMTDNRDSNAYHEAGHAAACHFLRLPLEYVILRRDGDKHGRTEVDDSEAVDRRHDYLVMSLAGAAAESQYNQGRPLPQNRRFDYYFLSAEADLRWVLEHLGPGEIIGPLDEEARRLVEEHWSTIEAIGEALLLSETLWAADVHAIADRVQRGEAERRA